MCGTRMCVVCAHVCIRVWCVCVRVYVCLLRSKDSFSEPSHFTFIWDSGTELRSPGLSGKHPYPPSHLAGPSTSQTCNLFDVPMAGLLGGPSPWLVSWVVPCSTSRKKPAVTPHRHSLPVSLMVAASSWLPFQTQW